MFSLFESASMLIDSSTPLLDSRVEEVSSVDSDSNLSAAYDDILIFISYGCN